VKANVEKVRLWFDKLTTHGPRQFKNQLAVHPERVEGRMANCDKVSKRLCRN